MNKILFRLVLGAVLAVIKAMLVVLTIAVVLVLAYGFVVRPLTTLAFLAALALVALAFAWPTVFVITLTFSGAVVALAILGVRSRGRRL